MPFFKKTNFYLSYFPKEKESLLPDLNKLINKFGITVFYTFINLHNKGKKKLILRFILVWHGVNIEVYYFYFILGCCRGGWGSRVNKKEKKLYKKLCLTEYNFKWDICFLSYFHFIFFFRSPGLYWGEVLGHLSSFFFS